MTKGRLFIGVVVLAAVWLAVWVARRTEWTDTPVPMPWRGEALRNPTYASQRFAEALGARTERGEGLELPSSDAVVVVTEWSWDVSATRRERLERWVEDGGRLVVDRSLISGSDAFESWSGIRLILEPDEDADEVAGNFDMPPPMCVALAESIDEEPVDVDSQTYEVCGLVPRSKFVSNRRMHWALRDGADVQALRVAVGDGSVTAINAQPFVWRGLFDGDHAALFVAATQLHEGDEAVFLSEQDYASLPVLIWRYGAPVVVLCALWLALALWRGGVRFGPLAAAADRARRSLAEQIRGTGQFALRFGGGAALHAAVARALTEAAARRVPGYLAATDTARAAALARATGFDAGELERALTPLEGATSTELRSAIALLEAARRRILNDDERAKHGKRIERDPASG